MIERGAKIPAIIKEADTYKLKLCEEIDFACRPVPVAVS